MTSLAVLDVDVRNVVKGDVFARQSTKLQIDVTDFLVRHDVAQEPYRYHHVEFSDGARVLIVKSDKPLTIYHGASVEGRRGTFFLEVGDFEGGISIDAETGTAITYVVAKEAIGNV